MAKFNKYGWRRDKPDKRDKHQMLSLCVNSYLPASVDLRSKMPEVYDQLELGSCTGQSLAADIHYQMIRQGGNVWMPSRLFIYYNERVIEGTVNSDSGAEIRDGMKVLNRWGICPEDICPYHIEKFKNKPSRNAFGEAARHKIVDYKRVPQTLENMKLLLAEGDSFVFGFTVYESFEGAGVQSTGIMTMPEITKEAVLGGHAVLAVGYDDHRQMFIIRNSWGKEWGDQGYFYMPYRFIIDSEYAADFWTVRLVPNV